jgi:hypothetical protein
MKSKSILAFMIPHAIIGLFYLTMFACSIVRIFGLFKMTNKIEKAEFYIFLHLLVILSLLISTLIEMIINLDRSLNLEVFIGTPISYFLSNLSVALILLFSICKKQKIGITPKSNR